MIDIKNTLGQVLISITIMIVIIYGSLIQQEIPDYFVPILDSKYFRMIMYIVIAFIGTHNIFTASMAAILFTVIINIISNHKINEYFAEQIITHL